MEDAKNAIMNRIRRAITSISRTHMFPGGQSSESLIRTALVSIQNTDNKHDRDCQVRNFLIDRMAFDMVNSSTALTEGEPPRLIPAIQELFNKGGQYATDVPTRYFVIKFSTDAAAKLDPAGLIGCHYHDHTPGQTSRVCCHCHSGADLFTKPATTSTQPSAPVSSASSSSGFNFTSSAANHTASSQSGFRLGSGLFTPRSSQSGQQQKPTETTTQQDTKPFTAHEATRPLFNFDSGPSSADDTTNQPVSSSGIKAEPHAFSNLPPAIPFGGFGRK